ncbi:MAG: ribokinase [Erysipelotrichaceae bacterium]|nr:ribokinase [Erysipelotrichaceae bacterium]
MKILVFGSTNIDHNYRMHHIARPKETVSSLGYEIHAGGKGLNQSIALARTGEHIYLAALVGNDAEMLMDVLKQNNVDTKYIRRTDAPNGHAIIQIDDDGENSIFLYPGTNNSITEEYVDWVLNDFSEGDFIILQNEINLQEYIINKAYEKGMVILMNPSPCDEKVKDLPLEKVSYFFINEVEGSILTGEEEPERVYFKMKEICPDSKVILTLGSEGSFYMDKDRFLRQEAYRVKAVDTVGAGDTFMGYFCYGLSQGMSPEECLLLATKASSITVTRYGAADSIPTLEEINEAYPD